MAKPADNRVALTSNPLIDGLTQGSAWTFSGAHVLTYSFSLDNEPTTRVQWTAAWKSAFTAALTEWSNVANLSFTEAGSGSNFNVSTADIAVTLTSDDLELDFAGLGIFPSPHLANLLTSQSDGFSYPRPEGDIFYVSTSGLFDSLEPGQVGFETILHEIGHALGLKHPFDDGINGRPTFASLGIAQLDSDTYTVMSYNGPPSLDSTGYAATPMPLDILAIQRIYGANMSYHTGDDVYELHDDGVMRTIWDASGDDTLDASSLTTATIDLRPGHLSYPGMSTFPGASVLAVAYNMTIERAIGTNSDDVIYGNDVANFIDGRGGADLMSGGPGNDTYVVDNVGDVVTELLNEGTDSVLAGLSYTLPQSVEQLVLTGHNDIDGVGNAQDNQITGNSGNNHLAGVDGNDRLLGGDGNDILDGGSGDDWLDGGAGSDSMRGGIGNDSYVADASDAPLLLAPYSLRLSGDPGEVISGGRVLYFTDATGTFSASTLFDLTGDGLVDYLTINYQEPGFSHTFSLSFAANHLGRNLAVGTYADAERAAFAAPGHPGLDVFGDGIGSNTLSGSFAIQALQIDYNGPAPVLVQFSATFEQHSDSPTAPALTGEIHYGAPGGTVEPIAELPDQGIDTVYAPVTYVLAPNFENLTLTGSANLDGTGNAGDNILTGNDGENVLDGGRGGDRMAGEKGDDTYQVDFGLDWVSEAANQGSDTIISQVPQLLTPNVENLTLGESAGNIEGIGNAGANTIIGNGSANLLDGAAGDDTLKGRGGDDTLLGGDGNDTLSGGLGRDLLIGGAGTDHFVFDSSIASGTNVDQIVDFAQAQHDSIDLSVAIFTLAGASGSTLAASTLVSEGGAVAHNADQHIIHDTLTGMLYYDADGNGIQHMAPFAHLTPGQPLAASDFHLIA